VRDVDSIRERKLKHLSALVARPSMYAGDGQAIEIAARDLLGDLCFVDQCDDKLRIVEEALRRRFGKSGVAGAFNAVFGNDCRYTEEVTSIVAEHAWRLGYLKVGRQLTDDEWSGALAAARDFEERDVARSEVVAQIGEPSLSVGHRVDCYASDGRESGWLCFDYWAQPQTRYVAGAGRYELTDASRLLLLRDARVPSPTFDDSFILTLYGKVLRWGTGWWIHHPRRRGDTPPGVPEHLRNLEDQDPSVSLDLRRP